MKNTILYAVFLVFFSMADSGAQHFIGLSKDESTVLARKSGFYTDRMTVSQKFNYQKYVNSAGTKTLIVFYDDNNISTHTRMVCDYSEFDFVRKDFDSEYRKKGDSVWEYKHDNESYVVSLEEEEWYFVVRVKKK